MIPGTKRSVASLQDITERKQAEAALAKEHQKLISILDGIPVSAFVIDQNSKVIIWNLVNEFFTGISKEQVLGKKIDLRRLFRDKAPPALAELVLRMTDEDILDKFAEKGMWKSNIHPEAFESIGSIWINDKEHFMAIQTTRLRNAQGDIVGAIQCAEDITERIRAEEERERLISELQKALSEVKILSGLLPICASCKKIRDDSGYWNQIESYIRDHSDAEFSHSICPECAQKIYPGLYEKVKDKV
jgi:signal transduction histidine kinase